MLFRSSGMLVFITLLLATDLGHPGRGRSPATSARLEQQLQETLAQQAEASARINRWQTLFTAADTAPGADKLEADIASLRLQLAGEQKKQAALDDQMTASQAAIVARDKALGLTELKATVDRAVLDVESIAANEAKARDHMNGLEQQVARAESQLLTLRERDGHGQRLGLEQWRVAVRPRDDVRQVSVDGDRHG